MTFDISRAPVGAKNVYHLYKVSVPLSHDGIRGWIFNLVCSGNAASVSHERLLLLKNATVNWNLGFEDVCKEKQVIIAYNNNPPWFERSNITGELVKYPVTPYMQYQSMVWEWEIQAAFFEANIIKPIWLNANFTWGTLNETTGQWSGAVGMIQRDEADYAIWGFTGLYAIGKVAAFSPPMDHQPYHWLTRSPQELPPTWNLLRLFTKGCNSQMSFIN